MFGFRTRDPRRDRDTDVSRQRRLIGLMDNILAEIQLERAGLEARYVSETERVAFLADTLTNERAAPAEWGQVDQLTASIIRYESRTAALVLHIEVIEQCRKKITDLLDQKNH